MQAEECVQFTHYYLFLAQVDISMVGKLPLNIGARYRCHTIGLHFTKVFLKCKLFSQHTLRNPAWEPNGSASCRFNHCMIMGDFCFNVKPSSSKLK